MVHIFCERKKKESNKKKNKTGFTQNLGGSLSKKDLLRSKKTWYFWYFIWSYGFFTLLCIRLRCMKHDAKSRADLLLVGMRATIWWNSILDFQVSMFLLFLQLWWVYCRRSHNHGDCPVHGQLFHVCGKKNHWSQMCRSQRKEEEVKAVPSSSRKALLTRRSNQRTRT